MKRNWIIVSLITSVIIFVVLAYQIGWRAGWDSCLGLKLSSVQEITIPEYQDPMTEQEAVTRFAEALSNVLQDMSHLELHIESNEAKVDLIIEQ